MGLSRWNKVFIKWEKMISPTYPQNCEELLTRNQFPQRNSNYWRQIYDLAHFELNAWDMPGDVEDLIWSVPHSGVDSHIYLTEEN